MVGWIFIATVPRVVAAYALLVAVMIWNPGTAPWWAMALIAFVVVLISLTGAGLALTLRDGDRASRNDLSFSVFFMPGILGVPMPWTGHGQHESYEQALRRACMVGTESCLERRLGRDLHHPQHRAPRSGFHRDDLHNLGIVGVAVMLRNGFIELTQRQADPERARETETIQDALRSGTLPATIDPEAWSLRLRRRYKETRSAIRVAARFHPRGGTGGL